jgi:hypothetical protein
MSAIYEVWLEVHGYETFGLSYVPDGVLQSKKLAGMQDHVTLSINSSQSPQILEELALRQEWDATIYEKTATGRKGWLIRDCFLTRCSANNSSRVLSGDLCYHWYDEHE